MKIYQLKCNIENYNRLVPEEKQDELYKVIEMKSFAVEEYGNMRMNEGMKEGFDNGMKEGFDNGRKEGYVDGRKEGFDNGRKEGKKEVACILKDKGYSKRDILESCKISEEEYLKL